MIHIRLGKQSDIPQLVMLYRNFYITTDYAQVYDMCDETVSTLTATLIDSGVLIVAEDDGVIVASAGCYVGPALFNSSIITSHEVVLYVDPKYRTRHIGQQLQEAIDKRASELGAVSNQMVRLSNSPEAAEILYKMNGYHPTEWVFTKRLV